VHYIEHNNIIFYQSFALSFILNKAS